MLIHISLFKTTRPIDQYN